MTREFKLSKNRFCVDLTTESGFVLFYLWIGRTGWPGDGFSIEFIIGTPRKGIWLAKKLWE